MDAYLVPLVSLFLTLNSGTDTKASVALLEARYHAAKTLQASFLERYSENGRVVRVEAGTAYFRRPGKMRWDYQAPEKNVFLVDGNTAWFTPPRGFPRRKAPTGERHWHCCLAT